MNNGAMLNLPLLFFLCPETPLSHPVPVLRDLRLLFFARIGSIWCLGSSVGWVPDFIFVFVSFHVMSCRLWMDGWIDGLVDGLIGKRGSRRGKERGAERGPFFRFQNKVDSNELAHYLA